MLKTQHTHSQQHQPTHTQQLAQHSLTLSHTHACARWASFFHLMSKPLVFERLCKKESGQNFHLHTWCVFFLSPGIFLFWINFEFFLLFFLMWILITRHFQHRFNLFGNFLELDNLTTNKCWVLGKFMNKFFKYLQTRLELVHTQHTRCCSVARWDWTEC